MGDFTFNRGDLNTITLTILSLSGTIPDPSRYEAPTLTITHVNGGGEVVDLVSTPMVQLGSTNRWFHKYTVPSLASFTRYVTTFRTIIDGIETIATEDFRVIPVAGSSQGSGEFEIELTVQNSVTMQPIPNATINVYDKNNTTVIIATDQTDAAGKALFYLSSGSYLVTFQKTGVVAETHTVVVDSEGHYTVDGD